MQKFFILIFILFLPLCGYGLVFPLPKLGDSLVGEPKTTQVKIDEDFSDIALRFDIGYYEVFEANPGINPDDPPVNTAIIIPTQYILPLELAKNTIVVNLAEMRLYYQPNDEKKVYIFPVGIGKEDWNTPLGEMKIVQKTKNPTWVAPKSILEFRKNIGDKIDRTIPPGPDNPMGKYALRLSSSSQGSYLIHGTGAYLASSVGRRSSAGCIRLYEADIEKLYKLVEVGTKVVIINKPYKAGWLNNKLYLEAHMPLFEQRIEMGDNMKPALEVVENAVRGYKAIIDQKKVYIVAKEHLTVPRIISEKI